MIKRFSLFICFILFSLFLHAQQDTLKSESPEEVVVRAFEQNRRLIDIAGSVDHLNRENLQRYNNTSIVTTLNTLPGVRMEERSPGSYRLNFRGSSLRSPFGVRNVKVYYNNIPFTDPGGNTYLNQLGFYNFESVEVLKGPGSSLYGAGTGGVMLIENNSLSRNKGISLTYSGGSFGLQNTNVNLNIGSDTFRNIVNFQHQSSDGYREQSSLKRDVFSWETTARINDRDKITGSFFYSNLNYQTPGALTLAEYQQNPKASRPRAGTNPGAKEAAAAIYQKMFLAGISYQKGFASNWQNTTTLYGAFTNLDNPAIRNYARNHQPHFGGRTVFQFEKNTNNGLLTWHTGAEMQQGFSTAKIYRNNGGESDSLDTDDEINTNTYFIFTQLTYAYKGWIASGGLSLNRSTVEFTRLSNSPATTYSLNFNNQIAPRLTLLRKLNNTLSVYGSWSKGFSPPTSEEIFPTGSLSNPDLSAEQGLNYEAGVKGSALKNRLSFGVSAFYFKLKNSIVQRRDAAGGDYYTNAGSTNQKGIESHLNFKLLPNNSAKKAAVLWASHTFYNFHYKNFKQVATDFSGNRLPGAAKHTFNAGVNLQLAGAYANIAYQYNDPIPLNDANTEFAAPFNLLTAKIGYRHAFKKLSVDVFAGGDNLFNVKYSLGNDLNGFGGRFYNAAPSRNYYAGITIAYNY